MRILFTGASSFTGAHFVRTLLDDGHEVWTTFSRWSQAHYTGLQQERIGGFIDHVRPQWNAPVGFPAFLELVGEQPFDIACFHGARAGPGWPSETVFDVVSAVQQNTRDLDEVVHRLKRGGTRRIVLTETYAQKIFPTPSAYALSKRITSDLFDFQCRKYGIPLARFVVPNPFGPYEDERFTTQATRCWIQGETVVVREAGIRDNIHVGLLARCYARFVRGKKDEMTPSGYRMSQPDFARLFAVEIGHRLGIGTPLDLSHAGWDGSNWWNDHPARNIAPEWDEGRAWDDLADYYRRFLPAK